MTDVTDDDVNAALDLLDAHDVDFESLRAVLAQDRARQLKNLLCPSCGNEMATLCLDCDEDALDGMGSQ